MTLILIWIVQLQQLLCKLMWPFASSRHSPSQGAVQKTVREKNRNRPKQSINTAWQITEMSNCANKRSIYWKQNGKCTDAMNRIYRSLHTISHFPLQSQPQGTRTPNWSAQPATKPRAGSCAKPPQAPVTLKPNSSVERELIRGDKEGTPRTAKLLKLNPQCHANRVMNMLQAWTNQEYRWTKSAPGLPQPSDCCKCYGKHQR